MIIILLLPFRHTNNILLWCWYLGSKLSSKKFEMEVELKATKSEVPMLRVRSPVFSLNATSYYDIEEFKKGLFLSSKMIEALGNPDQIILNISVITIDI